MHVVSNSLTIYEMKNMKIYPSKPSCVCVLLLLYSRELQLIRTRIFSASQVIWLRRVDSFNTQTAQPFVMTCSYFCVTGAEGHISEIFTF